MDVNGHQIRLLRDWTRGFFPQKKMIQCVERSLRCFPDHVITIKVLFSDPQVLNGSLELFLRLVIYESQTCLSRESSVLVGASEKEILDNIYE